MNIGVLVTSHLNYLVPLRKALETLSNFDHRLVVSGGHRGRTTQVIQNCNVINVDHDSYDYTGLIEVVTHPSLVDGWTHLLCVQDTMELGPQTYDLCALADPFAEATAAFGRYCNLVLYRLDYIRKQEVFILARRNCTKFDAIQYEGSLWTMATDRRDFLNSGVVNVDIDAPYSDTPRLKEYYPSLDVTKWKANYGQNMHALIDSP